MKGLLIVVSAVLHLSPLAVIAAADQSTDAQIAQPVLPLSESLRAEK